MGFEASIQTLLKKKWPFILPRVTQLLRLCRVFSLDTLLKELNYKKYDSP